MKASVLVVAVSLGCSDEGEGAGDASGGAGPTGGMVTGGVSDTTGGASTGGGATTGGSASGGATGGVGSGGGATGGTGTGGASGTGGSASGGSATGGSGTGGSTSLFIDQHFTDAVGWAQAGKSALIPGATVGVAADEAASDGSALAIFVPGDEELAGDEYAGPGLHAAEAVLAQHVHYGRFEFRVRFPTCSSDEELVSGLFTYFNDGSDEDDDGLPDNSEIDLEVLCGHPEQLWLTVWTDYQAEPEEFRKSTRVIDMHTGAAQDTPLGTSEYGGLAAAGSLPAVVQPDFPDPDTYYELGFDWSADKVRYFMWVDGAEVTLWELTGASYVPSRPGEVMLNLWHSTTHWADGSPADFPAEDATLWVDWVRVGL